jgi:hypothetical protein
MTFRFPFVIKCYCLERRESFKLNKSLMEYFER